MLIDGEQAAVFEGDTKSYIAEARFRENSIREGIPMPESWPAVNIEWAADLETHPKSPEGKATVEFKIRGDIRFFYWKIARTNVL